MEFGAITWYYNKQTNVILGFYPFSRGFYIVGGPTGSHHSGHSENADEKEKELHTQGYITVREAIEKGFLKVDWQPPKIKSSQDRRIIAHIDKVEGYLKYQDLKPWWVFG
jgi:hypothetical protein